MPSSRLSDQVLFYLASAGSVGTVACGGSPTGPDAPVPNFVQLQSDFGDYIGAGLSYSYGQANAILTVTAAGGRLAIDVQGDEQWSGVFQSPDGQAQLRPGTHSALERYPFNNPALGGLSWSGEGRGCNTLVGSFTIDSLTYTGTTLAAIDLRFEQHCEGGTAALRGTIHWRGDDATRPPGPVFPVPAALWQPGAGATSATGSYVYLTSDFGDYIGAGGAYTYTPDVAAISVTGNGGHVEVRVNGTEWSGDFQGMIGLDRLEAGYYGGLHRYPFLNPAKGGLQWSGQGRGCNRLIGWFAVDQITHTNGVLTALDLRFEQHCEAGAPALHGRIHWTG
jgi:hypothetical protein